MKDTLDTRRTLRASTSSVEQWQRAAVVAAAKAGEPLTLDEWIRRTLDREAAKILRAR